MIVQAPVNIGPRGVGAQGRFHLLCYDADGRLKWEEDRENIVVNVGRKDINEKYFSGSAYTAAFYMGITQTISSFVAGDTMSSHAGWTETTAYSQATRPSATFNSTATTANPSVISNSSSPATFSINATVNFVDGAFITTNNTKGGTTGTLIAGTTLSITRAVVSGDTLVVTYTFSLTGT